MPDSNKLGTTTRLLLQETQAHMEKFAARMDALGAHVEQSLREIQMCRTATEGASEKCVSEVVDVGESNAIFLAFLKLFGFMPVD